MCFDSGDDSSSREMIQMQKDEAAAARAKEAKRQKDINSGLQRIKEAFHGKEITTPTTYDWKNFNPATAKSGGAVSGLPAGFTFVKQPGKAATPAVYGPASFTAQNLRDNAMSGGGGSMVNPAAPTANSLRDGAMTTNGAPAQHQSFTAQNLRDLAMSGNGDSGGGGAGLPNGGYGTPGQLISAAVAATPDSWVIKGPDGKLYKVGDTVTGQQGTGKFKGGIGDDFYNSFKQGILDFYQPQVAEKYADAQRETTFRLADAGTLRSSAANRITADLAKQNLLNTADVRSKADTAAGELRGRVAGEEAKATSQLFATENPDVAASQATRAVTNITADKPTTTPLGDIFNIAAIGGAKFLQGADNAAFARRVGGLTKPTQYTRTVG